MWEGFGTNSKYMNGFRRFVLGFILVCVLIGFGISWLFF